MQDELDAMDLPVDVQIIGVNQVGHESQNATMVEGRDLPWLQETADLNVWNLWDVTYRDVILLDLSLIHI